MLAFKKINLKNWKNFSTVSLDLSDQNIRNK